MKYATASNLLDVPRALSRVTMDSDSVEDEESDRDLDGSVKTVVLVRFPYDYPLVKYEKPYDPWRWEFE